MPPPRLLIRLSDRIPLVRINPASFRLFFGGVWLLCLLFPYFVSEFIWRTYQDEIEEVILPDVPNAVPDENPDPERLVIWVLKDGITVIGGRECSDEDIRSVLLVESRLTRDQEGIADRTVMVKADERTPFKHVMKIINWCREPNIGISRLSFGIRPAP